MTKDGPAKRQARVKEGNSLGTQHSFVHRQERMMTGPLHQRQPLDARDTFFCHLRLKALIRHRSQEDKGSDSKTGT